MSLKEKRGSQRKQEDPSNCKGDGERGSDELKDFTLQHDVKKGLANLMRNSSSKIGH